MEPQPIVPAGPELDEELDALLERADEDDVAVRASTQRRDGAVAESIDAQILAGLVSP